MCIFVVNLVKSCAGTSNKKLNEHLSEIMQNNKYIKQTKETPYIRRYKLHGTNRIKYVTIIKGNYLNHRNVKFCA